MTLTMATKETCAACGTTLGENASEGLCPKCLFAATFKTDLDATKLGPGVEPAIQHPESTPFVTRFGDFFEQIGRAHV